MKPNRKQLIKLNHRSLMPQINIRKNQNSYAKDLPIRASFYFYMCICLKFIQEQPYQTLST